MRYRKLHLRSIQTSGCGPFVADRFVKDHGVSRLLSKVYRGQHNKHWSLDCQSYIILYCKKSRCETSIDWKKLPRSTYNNKRWFLGLPRFVLRDRTQLRNAFKIHTQLVLHRIVTVIVIYIVTWERSNQWLSKPYQEQHNNKRWSVVIVKVV